ncbi:hypothetical protein ILYODFUR_024234 [Ilyodon furcidens]|uniref:Uncharacterized protein n=1 Tax=Ilyodon furcidens TaxID=33524 RepID=A0ABV0SRE6_9TELE
MLRKVLTTSPVNQPGILLPVHPPTVHIATRTKNKENLNCSTLLKTPSLLNKGSLAEMDHLDWRAKMPEVRI